METSKAGMALALTASLAIVAVDGKTITRRFRPIDAPALRASAVTLELHAFTSSGESVITYQGLDETGKYFRS